MSNSHSWCHDVQRDVAIRAAEDAAAVPSIQHRDLPAAVEELRRRVARMESRRERFERLMEARMDKALLPGLSTVRVTLDVTIREDDTELFDGEETLAEGIASYIRGELRPGLGERASVVDEPRWWLTAGERGALKRAFDLLCDDDGDQPLAGTVQRLLARSTPPRVRRPQRSVDYPHQRDAEWIAAIREAGGEVEE